MPMSLTILVVAAVAGTLLPRFGPRALIVAGLLLSTVGLVLLAQLDSSSGYAGGVLPGILVIGVAAGLLFTTAFATGTLGVDERDAGVASAMLNTAQQIGGSIGAALLSTLFASAVSAYADDNPGPRAAVEASIHGYTTVFWWGAAITLVGAAVAFVLMRSSAAAMAAAGDHQPAGVGAH
jgi:fucose permease